MLDEQRDDQLLNKDMVMHLRRQRCVDDFGNPADAFLVVNNIMNDLADKIDRHREPDKNFPEIGSLTRGKFALLKTKQPDGSRAVTAATYDKAQTIRKTIGAAIGVFSDLDLKEPITVGQFKAALRQVRDVVKNSGRGSFHINVAESVLALMEKKQEQLAQQSEERFRQPPTFVDQNPNLRPGIGGCSHQHGH